MIHIDGFTWRLGNQLFQLAAAINVAEENIDSVVFPEWKYAKYFEGDFAQGKERSYFNTLPHLVEWEKYQEPRFAYDRIPYRRNLSINGYFQSEKYFKNSAKLISKMFRLKPAYRFDNQPHTCSIHIRRTDYIDLNTHFHTLTLNNFYKEAMTRMEVWTGRIDKFYIFSDDMDWCEENFCLCDGDYTHVDCPVHNYNHSKIKFYHGDNEIEDFSKMKSCQYNIIANSSYSWWAAWLNDNPDKKVYAPDHAKWFGPALAMHDTKDLIPEEWTRL